MLNQTPSRLASERVANDITDSKLRCKDHIANSGYTSGSFMQRTGMLFWSGALLFGSLKPLDVKITGIAPGPSLCRLSIISSIFFTSRAVLGESHHLLTDGLIKAGEGKVPMEC
ncbi:uncharacterized protein ACIBXB_013876 isoform 4-T4 [Morphnus guianensis]